MANRRCRLEMLFAAGALAAVLSASYSLRAADEEVVPLLKTFAEELVEITPGEGKFPKTLAMGSDAGDEPVREVTLTEPFAIAKYEVPQNLYEAVMGSNPSKWKGPRNSAEMMTHAEAQQFCEKLTQLLREQKLIAADEAIRLPTEIEWEYCCRAGTKTAYSFGDEARKPGDAGNKASILDEYGWHTGNAAGNDPPVGAKKPNPWGLYDLHGYLWEFTSDRWSPAEDSSNGAEKSPDLVAIRGGSWKSRYPELRSSARMGFPRDRGDDAVGIRCVKAKVAEK